MTQQEISETLVELELKLKKESKVYGIFTIILSILDVLCGVLCIIFTSIQITALVMSIASGTIICSRAIQVLKTRNLVKTIRILNGVSGTYLAFRVKKGEYMKKIFTWIKNNKLTLLVSTLGFVVCGFAGYYASALIFMAPKFVYFIVGAICSILSVVLVMILGNENALQFFLRTAVGYLPKEYQEQVSETVKNLQSQVNSEKEQKTKEAALKKEVQRAKVTVETYEKANESYLKAKKLLEDNKELLVEKPTASVINTENK